MVQKTSPKLSDKDLQTLSTSLPYLKVEELRSHLQRFGLDERGIKRDLINRIEHFIKTGEELRLPDIPEASRAKSGAKHELRPDALILFGLHKNDRNTRHFLKRLIGDHFNNTAYGLDWISQRWVDGNPPTYQEFADYWQSEYMKRKDEKAVTKKEFASLIFSEDYIKKHPEASRDDIVAAWHKEREKHVRSVAKLLK